MANQVAKQFDLTSGELEWFLFQIKPGFHRHRLFGKVIYERVLTSVRVQLSKLLKYIRFVNSVLTSMYTMYLSVVASLERFGEEYLVFLN